MIRFCLLALIVAPLACGEKDAPTKADAAPASTTTKFTLAKDPGPAISVNDAKAAAPRDEVVVEGRIDNIVDGYVTFNLVDASLAYCGQVTAEDCPTPWDYCCFAPDKKSAATLTVEVNGPDGEVVEMESIPGLRLLDRVAVKGRLSKDEHGNVTVHATGWYRRDRPTLPDHVRWPE